MEWAFWPLPKQRLPESDIENHCALKTYHDLGWQSQVRIPLPSCLVLWQLKTTAPSWQMPPFDKLLWKNLHVKGCVWAAWHKRGQQAEKSVTLTAVRAVHLTLNYGQNFFQVQLLVEIIGISIRGWGSNSSITDAIFLNNREKTDCGLTIFHSRLHTTELRWKQWPFAELPSF